MIGILTFHWADDCGAMLQAYALKRYLELQGEQVEFVPYAPIQLTGRYWWCPLASQWQDGRIRHWPSRSGWKRHIWMGRSFWQLRRAMRSFRRQYLTAKAPVRRAQKLSLRPYTCVFVGSDQVWNPVITVGLDDAYLGNIPDRGDCRLVAYAASFGGPSLPQVWWEPFAKYVGGNFAAISVRERSAKPFVEGLLYKRVEDVLDPTQLLERGEWEAIAKRPNEEGYILTYCTEYNREMMQYLEKLSAALHARVIQISLPMWDAGEARRSSSGISKTRVAW